MEQSRKYMIIGIVVGLIGIGLLLYFRKNVKDVAVSAYDYASAVIWDQVSQSRIDKLHPKIQPFVKELIKRAEDELGLYYRVTDGLRDFDEQNELYASGRTEPGPILTNAMGGESWHNYGLAVDIVEIKDGEALYQSENWPLIAQLAKSIGFEWGGDFTSITDKPHFQMRFNNSIAQMYSKYEQNGGNYVPLAA